MSYDETVRITSLFTSVGRSPRIAAEACDEINHLLVDLGPGL